jgi:hypothetical protein
MNSYIYIYIIYIYNYPMYSPPEKGREECQPLRLAAQRQLIPIGAYTMVLNKANTPQQKPPKKPKNAASV